MDGVLDVFPLKTPPASLLAAAILQFDMQAHVSRIADHREACAWSVLQAHMLKACLSKLRSSHRRCSAREQSLGSRDRAGHGAACSWVESARLGRLLATARRSRDAPTSCTL